MASIINGLLSGRTGIASHGSAIAVIGDNISNASTIGYKASRAEFSDIIAGGGGSGGVVGAGSQAANVSTIFQQGTFEYTGRSLDLAVDGAGTFVLSKDGERFYSRAGNFLVDKDGYIVSQGGLNVQGYSGSLTAGGLVDLSINNITQSNVSTANATIAGNLDSRATAATIPNIQTGATAVPDYDPTFATVTNAASYVAPLKVFDTLGASHDLSIAFYKTGTTGQWNVEVYAVASEVDAAADVASEPRRIGTSVGGTPMTFNSSGVLTGGGSLTLTNIPWVNGSDTNQDIVIDLSGFTQYANLSSITAQTQDGKGVGTVTSLSVGKDGQLFALLSNGQSSVLGSIALANFANVEGLTRVGSNLMTQSNTSGEPIIGVPQSGPFGKISAGALELSTSDIASEFVKLIQLQRGFQASTRVVTTINQLLNDIIQLA